MTRLYAPSMLVRMGCNSLEEGQRRGALQVERPTLAIIYL